MPKAIAKLIHIGAKTQNQDHVIKPVSFKVMNTIVKSPANPMPPLVELLDDELLLILFLCDFI